MGMYHIIGASFVHEKSKNTSADWEMSFGGTTTYAPGMFQVGTLSGSVFEIPKGFSARDREFRQPCIFI